MTVIEALRDLQSRGFTANFAFLNRRFRDVDSGRTFSADQLAIVEHHRYEGASDPDDMSIVYAIESHDGAKGTVTDAFGTYASPELGAFLHDVRRRRDTAPMDSVGGLQWL